MLLADKRRSDGFSMIELVVVVGIIAVTLSLLLPAIGATREHANQISCLGKLRSISQAASLHLLTHDGYLPATGHHWDLAGGQLDPKGLGDSEGRRYDYFIDGETRRPVPITAAFALAMDLSVRTDSRENLMQDLERPEMIEAFHCPSQVKSMRGISQIGPGWISPLEYSSYIFNEAVMGRREIRPGRSLPICGNVVRVSHPTQVFLAADGNPRGGLEGEIIDIPNSDDHETLSSFVELTTWGPQFARGHLDYVRHGYRINVVYLDGHAETLYMTDGSLQSVGVSQGIYD